MHVNHICMLAHLSKCTTNQIHALCTCNTCARVYMLPHYITHMLPHYIDTIRTRPSRTRPANTDASDAHRSCTSHANIHDYIHRYRVHAAKYAHAYRLIENLQYTNCLERERKNSASAQRDWRAGGRGENDRLQSPLSACPHEY